MADGGGEELEEHGPVKIADGEWAGWYTWQGHDPFESSVGPFYSRRGEDGHSVCAFRAEQRHMNGGDHMHGGCMMSFADFALFSLSHDARRHSPAVTVSLNSEFLGPAFVGERVEAKGEVTRAGKSLIFVRGLLTAEGRPILNFSGIIKKVTRRG